MMTVAEAREVVRRDARLSHRFGVVAICVATALLVGMAALAAWVPSTAWNWSTGSAMAMALAAIGVAYWTGLAEIAYARRFTG